MTTRLSLADITAVILGVATDFAARAAKPSDRIYADLNINGYDVIDFVETLEKRYGVDLDWVSPHDANAQFYDASLLEIAEYIESLSDMNLS
ncbi:MAG TPA: hypothetical protein VJR87_04525 [Allosphingosinicella sp.]|nr:hypothetical protein [Allosphingosinicella sp.]